MTDLSQCNCENGRGITAGYLSRHPEASTLAQMVVQNLAQQEYEHKQLELERLNKTNSGAPINGILVIDIVDPLRFIHVGADYRPQVLLLGHDTIPEQAHPFTFISKDLIPLISETNRTIATSLLSKAGGMITMDELRILESIKRTGSLLPLFTQELKYNILKFHPLCGTCPLLLTDRCRPNITYLTDLSMLSSMAWGSMEMERHLIN